MAFNRTTQTKRQRERAKQEKREAKAQRRADRTVEKKNRDDPGEEEVDPDIAGIVPGPQPVEDSEAG